MDNFIRCSGATKDFVGGIKNANSDLLADVKWDVRRGNRIENNRIIYTITFFAITISTWTFKKEKERDKYWKLLEINKQLDRPEDLIAKIMN